MERDTHVSKRYLHALEMEDFAIFPAPVYARGFLRTYSRYLGLNPEELIRVFPNGDLTVDITPLPTVTRPPSQLINVNWLVAGLVGLFLLGAALLLLHSNDSASIVGTNSTNGATSTGLTPGGGQPCCPSGNGTAQGKVIAPARPGMYPDFVGADKPSAEAVLRDNQLSYVIVEVVNRTTPRASSSARPRPRQPSRQRHDDHALRKRRPHRQRSTHPVTGGATGSGTGTGQTP